MSPDHVYVLDRGRVNGPFTHAQLHSMQRQGVINTFTKVAADQRSWVPLDDYFRAHQARQNAPEPLRPPPLAAAHEGNSGGLDASHLLSLMPRTMPVWVLVLLHYLTGGVFTFFWITALHGVLPKLRSDDPSGGRAVGLCFVPLYNLYWLCLVFIRLSKRVNALSFRCGEPPQVAIPLAYAYSVCQVIPLAMATAGILVITVLSLTTYSLTDAITLFFVLPLAAPLLCFVFIAPIFSGQIQHGINRAVFVQIRRALQEPNA